MTRRASKSIRVAFYPLMVCLVLLAIEGMTWFSFKFLLPHHEIARRVMMGGGLLPEHFQNSIGQAYLLYAPAPDYKDGHGVQQHNDQGYRGRAVALARTPGVLRILAMGGSTTYGWETREPDQTWPAWLEKLISERIVASHQGRPGWAELPGLSGVEVINAGLPWGTSAELLTHYHFKFRYYKPDIVVINTGGNDADALTHPYYQPDYAHQRKPMDSLRLLPLAGRILAHSRFLSLLLIETVHGKNEEMSKFRRERGLKPDIYWFKGATKEPVDPVARTIPPKWDAFRVNMNALLDMISKDGARTVLVAFRENPAQSNDFPDLLRKAFDWTEDTLRDIARERQLPFAPFPAGVISPKNWMDACHLNGAGNREKAAHIIEYVWPVVRAVSTESRK